MMQQLALYIRLSHEDLHKSSHRIKDESNSITVQRQLLSSYIHQQSDLSSLPQLEFKDDGFSGTTLKRPAFQQMMELVREGQIGVILVKDLSRLGRDYIEVGKLLDHVLPSLGVRIISVNDRYDSSHHKGQTAGIEIALKNLVYDVYSKDLSAKVRASIEIFQKKASYVTTPPYGYRLDPLKKHCLLVDEESAAVVREMFRLRLQEFSIAEIAEQLNQKGVLTPSAYLHVKGKRRLSGSPDNLLWTYQMVRKLLGNIKYTGTMVNNTTRKRMINDTSYQNVPKEQWYYREDAHEAIVSKEDFYTVQAMLTHHKRKAPVP